MTREVDGPVSVGRCSKGKTDGFCLGSVKLCTFFTLEKKLILIIHNTTLLIVKPRWNLKKKNENFGVLKIGSVKLQSQNIQYIFLRFYGGTNLYNNQSLGLICLLDLDGKTYYSTLKTLQKTAA